MTRIGGAMILALVVGCGCGGAVAPRSGHARDATHLRDSVAGRDARPLAPQVTGEADAALKDAVDAERAGDTLGAQLHGERAVASYSRAIALARLARATEEADAARAALDRAQKIADTHRAARAHLATEGDELEKKIVIAKNVHLPQASDRTDPSREKARLEAASALAMHARLLCGAARLVRPAAAEGAQTLAEVDALDKAIAAHRPSAAAGSLVDEGMRLRARCLARITEARRDARVDGTRADTLLGELGAAAQGAEAAPRRDERGVVVTLRNAFQGSSLVPAAGKQVEAWGRVARAHGPMALQVVIHASGPASAEERERDAQRAAAIVHTLTSAGAAAEHVSTELAGARAPVVPSADGRHPRNARVEIVFVPIGG